jgi:hypothetical protein
MVKLFTYLEHFNTSVEVVVVLPLMLVEVLVDLVVVAKVTQMKLHKTQLLEPLTLEVVVEVELLVELLLLHIDLVVLVLQ